MPSFTGNLPAEPNSFVGRERDLTELADLLGEVRALTLCGPGGIGKTRLALRLAATLAPEYRGGAWIVDLADADDPGLLAPLVATVLGILAEPDQPLTGTLTEALRPRSMLLILDTCEHLVGACAGLVRQLLASCPGLRVISTSREPLRIRGEVTWRVAPLGLPMGSPLGAAGDEQAEAGFRELAGCEAVKLFAERAAAARPGFTVQQANIRAVERICRTLDGMPLAIELAAARMRALSSEQIADRLADRFALLATGDRAAPRRHLTLRAAVAWSYDLLTPAEQVLLRRLCVFAGWNLEMAELVCGRGSTTAGQVLDLLTALIDKSLVIVDGELNGDARYRLLDTVRQYAVEQAEQAAELAELRVAHRDCMLLLQERGVERAFAPADLPWSERVAVYHRGLAEQANTRAALALSAERGDAEEGLRLCIAMRPIWLTGGDATDGAAMLDRLLALDRDVSPAVRTRALSLRAELALYQQDLPAAAEFARQCGQVSPPGQANASALRIQAVTAVFGGQIAEAMDLAEAALAAASAAADDWEVGVAHVVRAAAIGLQGRLDDAQRAYEVALEVLGEGRGWGRAQALVGLGRLASARGDSASALRYFGAALAMYRQINARSDIARCLAFIGWQALAEHDLPLARSSLAESLRLSLAAGQRLAVARAVDAHAAVAAASGNLATALRLAGASQALCEVVGAAPSGGAGKRLEELRQAADSQLGQDTAAALFDEGRAMSAEAAVRLATAPQPAPRAFAPAAAAWPPDSPAALARQAADIALSPLTSREREVASGIYRGLSNAAIAAELSIRPSTAARHVANILTKLNFRSRAQIAAWVADQMRGGE